MGEEYGEPNPFRFFSDHQDPDVRRGDAEGRKREFAAYAAFSARTCLTRRIPRRSGGRSCRAARRRECASTTAGCSRSDVGCRATCDVQTDGQSLTMRRGNATLVVDFAAKTVELAE